MAQTPAPENARPAGPRVAIGVATYRRPEGLARLLDALANQRVAEGVALEIVVVDNDPEASAEAACAAERDTSPWPVHYVVEKRRGIPQARNAILDRVLPSFDWLAFTDDDALPEPGWVQALLDAQARTGADAVTGPSLPAFEQAPPAWLAECFARSEGGL